MVARPSTHEPGEGQPSSDVLTTALRFCSKETAWWRIDRWIAAFLGTRRSDGFLREPALPASLGWSPVLALGCGMTLLLASHAANANRLGNPNAVQLFYVAIAAIFLPTAVRLLSPLTSRPERIALTLLVTAALFVIRVIRAPTAFVDHDEFLHWATANDILDAGRLFLPNPLLPVSPLYPGLELVTTGLVNATGLGVFATALIVLGVARLLFMLALFLFFERITSSARVASLACLVFMGSSAFLIFDLHYSYQSLAVPLLVVLLLAAVESREEARWSPMHLPCVVLPLLLGLALTHHMTSFFAAAMLGAIAVIESLRRGAGLQRSSRFIVLTAFAFAIPLVWSKMIGDPTSGYLGPVFKNGFGEVAQLLDRTSGRALFVSDDGTQAAAWQRYLALGGVAFVCLGLLTGFLRAFNVNGVRPSPSGLVELATRRSWHSSALIVLTAMTIAFPISMVFRLTRSGWEIGNRVGGLSFFGVAIVVAIAIARFWQGNSTHALRRLAVAAALTVMLVSGIISSEGPRILVPEKYEVSSDSSSVEPMGIFTAEWTLEWLGRGHLFVADRINRLFLATYGRQLVATTLEDWRDTSVAVLAPVLGPAERALLIQSRIDYVMVDLRITTSLPGVGVYFDGGISDRHHETPPDARALLKFNGERSLDRVFDNGFIIIFDVRRLANG